jgi:ADP-heptose:LPS heptosyltransferase
VTFAGLCALIEQADLTITNNTGPMHVAAAVGTPVVILMQHHPMLGCYVPRGERHRVVHAPSIEQITPDEVYAVARSVFTAERASSLFSR